MATQPPDHIEEDFGPAERERAFLEQRLSPPEPARRAVQTQQDATSTSPEIPTRQLLATLPANWYKNQMDAYRQRQQQRKRAVPQAISVRAAPPQGPLADSWIPLGPSIVDDRGDNLLVSGRATDIAIAPGQGTNGQDRLYLASANGGVWRSDDSGQSWHSLMNAFDEDPQTTKSDSLACGAIAIDPANPDVIYVGTGEGYSNITAYFGVGPVVSRDGGLNWQTEPVAAGSDPLGGNGFYALVLDPDDANVVLAATNIGLYRRRPDGRGGYEWAQITLGAGAARDDRVTSIIVVRPAAGGKVFFAAKADGRTYRSNDGQVWAVFGNQLPNAGNAFFDRVSLAASPDDDQNIYALVNNDNAGQVFRLRNGQWQSIAGGPANYLGAQGFYNLELTVDPNNVNRIYIGGAVDSNTRFAALFRATVALNAGAFSMVYDVLGASLHADLHRIRFQGNNSDNLWICCDGGVFHTTRATDANNLNTMFTPNNSGLATMTMMNMGRNSSSDALILCGTQDNGGQRYTASEVWVRISDGDSGFAAQNGRSTPATRRSQIIFTYIQNRMKLFRAYGSDTQGTTRDVPVAGDRSEGYAPLVVAPGSDVLAFGSTRPWIGTGMGSNWVSIPNNNAAQDNVGGTITALTFYDQNKLYVGTVNGRVYRYDFNAAANQWQQLRIDAWVGLGVVRINRIAIDYADPTGNSIYAALNTTRPADWRHVWHYDAARGWQSRSGPAENDPATLLPVSTNALITDPRNTATLYAGLDIGVWRSQDGGATWHPFSEGLPDAAVIDLLMDLALPVLRVSTHGRGVFERALDVFIFPQTHLYLRDSAADRGMYPSLAGVDDPSQSNSGGPVAKVDLNNSPDIKISTDPALQAQIDFVQFYKAGDSASSVSRARAVRVYVQVHNRGTTTHIVDDVRVMLLMTREGFSTNAPMLPSDIDRYVRQGIALENAGWTTLGIKTLNGVSATVPQVISFDVDTNKMPAAGDQGCMVALVDQADDAFASADGATVLELNSGTFVQQNPVDNFPVGGLTLALWLRVNPGWPDNETAYVFIYDGGNADTQFYVRNPTNLEVGFGTRTTGPTGVQLHDGDWHHLAIVLTPADATHYRVSIYTDGLLMFQSDGALEHDIANVLQAHQGLIIGSNVAHDDDAQFVGWMTEFCLWNSVLTEEQLQTRMHMRIASDTPGLALYLPLDSPDARVTAGGWLQAGLLFRQNTVTATWDDVAGATYNFEITDGAGTRIYWTEQLTTNSLAFNTTSLENFTVYNARVQTVTNNSSTWSNPVVLNVVNLPPPNVDLVYNAINNTLTAGWQAIGGVNGYEVSLSSYNALGETARTVQTLDVATTRWDLTTKLQDNTGTRLEVRSLRDQGSRSPASVTGLLGAAPVLSLSFTAETDATGKIRANWIPGQSDGADFYYLQVFDGNQPDPGHLNSQARVPLDQTSADIAAAPHEGDTFTVRIRPIGQGNIGLWGDNAILVTHYLASPVVTLTEQADGSLTASWNDIRTPSQSGLSVSYEVAVYKDGAAQPETTLVIKAGDPREYSIPAALVRFHVYRILVRGFTVDTVNRATSYGLWSPETAVGTPVVRFYYDNASQHLLLGFDAVTGASFYDVEVYAGNQVAGAPIFHQSYVTAQQDFTIPLGAAPNPADQFTARVRAYAGGTTGAWCTPITVVVAELTQPATVTFDVPTADGSLTAHWIQVPGADGAEIQLVPGNGNAPTIMSAAGTSHTFPQLLATSDVTYLVKVRAFTNQHSYSSWSEATLPTPSTFSFMYHVDTGKIIASWDMPTAGSKSFLQAFEGAVPQGTAFQQQGYNTAAISVELTPPPPAGHANITNGTTYNGRVRTMANGGISTWVNQGLIVHDFAAPTVTFHYINPLSTQWHAVTDTSSNAPTEYQVFAFPVGGSEPLFKAVVPVVTGQADYSYTLTDSQKSQLLTSASAINIQVRAVGDNSVSALSAVPALTAPAITTLTYTHSGPGGTFEAQWAARLNAEYYYLIVYTGSISDTSPARMITASAGASGAISINDVANLATYQASVKTLGGGAVTALSAAVPLEIYTLPGPTDVQVRGQNTAITASYTFDQPSWLPQNVYDAIVYQGTVTLGGSTYNGNSQPGQKSLTIRDTHFVDNTDVSVQVRATTTTTTNGVTTASYGLYSTPPNVLTIGALDQVTGLYGASTSSEVNIQWDHVDRAQNYSLQIYASKDANGNSLCPIPNVADSGSGKQSTTLQLSNCSALQQDTTYYIRARALGANNLQGPWSDWASVTIQHSSSTDPNHNGNSGNDTDPVNVATGSYAYSNVDLIVPGVVPIQFTTFYATSTGLPSDEIPIPNVPMGNRWSHSYNAYLQIDNDNKQVAIFWWTGAISVYEIPSSQSGYYTLKGIPNGDSLYHDTSGSYTLTRKDQTKLRFTSGGQLYEIENPIGNKLLLTYSQNRLDKVQDQGSGHFIQFGYNGNLRIKQVSDNFGRSISYDYYDNGDLKSYTDLGNNKRQFSYDNPSLMNNITDQNIHTLVANTYYHNPNRVHVQTDGRGNTTTFEYTTEQYNGHDTWKTTVTDRNHKQKTYYSDPNNGNLLELRQLLENGNLRRIIYTYDGFNNLISETISEAPSGQSLQGNVTGFGYDGNNNLNAINLPTGDTFRIVYDSRNRVTSTTDTNGNTVTYQYDGSNLKTVTMPYNKTVTYEYYGSTEFPNIQGLIKTQTDINGNTVHYEYNSNGTVKMVTNALGNVVSTGYDNFGRPNRLTEQTSGDASTMLRETTLTYTAQGWVESQSIRFSGQTAAQAFTYTYKYDNLGKPTHVYAPDNPTQYTLLEYDNNNNLYQTTFPARGSEAPVQWIRSYDGCDQLHTNQRAPGIVETFAYDAIGRLTSIQDARLKTTDIAYALIPRPGLTGVYDAQITTTLPPLDDTKPTGRVSRVEVTDPLGRPVSYKDTDTSVTTYTYALQQDPDDQHANRLIITTTLPLADSHQTQPYTLVETYDALGRLIERQNEWSKTTRYAYSVKRDAASNTYQVQLTITDPLNNTSVETYDALNRLVDYVSGTGNEQQHTAYQYDALGRLTQTTEYRAGGTQQTTTYTYEYVAANNTMRTNVKGPNSVTQPNSLEYDSTGKLVKASTALGKTFRYSYKPNGLLDTAINGRGQSIVYGYDAAGRLESMQIPNNITIKHIIDANGNRKQTKANDVVQIQREFDNWNRLISRTDASNNVVGYTYTPANFVHTITYPDPAKTVTYEYDGLNRLKNVTDWHNRITTYTYYPTGRLQRIDLPDSSTVTYSYDDASQLIGVTDTRGDRLLFRETYVPDSVGNRHTSEAILPLPPVVAARRDTAHFNDDNQITDRNGNAAYTYDDDGNLVAYPGFSGQAQYDVFNQMTQYGSDVYTYDTDGFRTRTEVSGLTTQFVYDVGSYHNPMRDYADPRRETVEAALYPHSAGGQVGLPTYGGLNLDPIVTNYGTLDRALEERDTNGNVQARYVHGLGLISREAADGTGYRVFHYDSRGSTIALTDSSGAITDRYAYSPFGELVNRAGQTPNKFCYSGRDGVWLDGNGLLYMRSRYFNSGLVRFMQQDILYGSAMQPQSFNRYAYVVGNPVSYIDPLGLSGSSDSSSDQSWWQKLGDAFKNYIGPIIGGALTLGAVGLGIYFAPEIAGFFGISSEFLSGARVLESGNTLEMQSLFDETATLDEEATLNQGESVVQEESVLNPRSPGLRYRANPSANRFANRPSEAEPSLRRITNAQLHNRWLKGRNAWNRLFKSHRD